MEYQRVPKAPVTVKISGPASPHGLHYGRPAPKVGGAIICGRELCGCSAVDRLRGHGQDARSESRPPKGRPQILVCIYVYMYICIYVYMYVYIYIYII